MRSPALVLLMLIAAWAPPAEARLFWQTYGSMVPTAEGCQWNTNSDYFVPRYCDSGRYGLFSPAKRACTTSPACRRCHALYPGYCSPYGCFHYCRLNHIYARKCGCSPVAYRGPYRPGYGPHLCESRWCRTSCHDGMCLVPPVGESMCAADCLYLPNVESAEFQILGSISLSGDPLLSSLQLGGPAAGLSLPPGSFSPETVMPGALPAPPAIPKIPRDPQGIPVYPNPELQHAPHPSVPASH